MEKMALHFMRSINLSSSYKESNKAKIHNPANMHFKDYLQMD